MTLHARLLQAQLSTAMLALEVISKGTRQPDRHAGLALQSIEALDTFKAEAGLVDLRPTEARKAACYKLAAYIDAHRAIWNMSSYESCVYGMWRRMMGKGDQLVRSRTGEWTEMAAFLHISYTDCYALVHGYAQGTERVIVLGEWAKITPDVIGCVLRQLGDHGRFDWHDCDVQESA